MALKGMIFIDSWFKICPTNLPAVILAYVPIHFSLSLSRQSSHCIGTQHKTTKLSYTFDYMNTHIFKINIIVCHVLTEADIHLKTFK